MHKSQSGTLYELPIIGLLLAITGTVLADRHPIFLALIAVGICLPFLPSILKWIDVIHRAIAAKKRWQDLCAQGLRPAVVVRAQAREGGAYIAVDISAGKVAFITADGCQLLDLNEVKEVRLTSGSVSHLGSPSRERMGLQFILKNGTNSFGLSYPYKRKAVNAFNKLRKALDAHMTFVEHRCG